MAQDDHKLLVTFGGGGAPLDPIELTLPAAFVERFEVLKPLGQGGMGAVFAARDRRLGRTVAIKILTMTDEVAVARFLLEGRAMAKVAHPNIVAALDMEVVDGHPYLVSELMEGGSLADLLAREKRLGAERVRDLMAPVLDALQACHDAGFVHRDLKPANVLLAADGTPKIADLGLVRHFAGDQALTKTGAMVGTPTYMAPEQVMGEQVTPAGDVYASGVLLFELLAGERPFATPSLSELLVAIATRKPRDVRDVVPDVPERLAHLIASCLERDPARRPASAAAVRAELVEALGAPARRTPTGRLPRPRTTGSARRLSGATSIPPSVPPATSRTPWVVAALALAVTLGGALAFSRRTPEPSSPIPRDASATPTISAATSPPAASPAAAGAAALHQEIRALWKLIWSQVRRIDEVGEMLGQINADPEKAVPVLAGVQRELAAAAPRLETLGAAVRALEEQPGREAPATARIRARAAVVAFHFALWQWRTGLLLPRARQMVSALQTADLILAVAEEPHPPELSAQMRRALADLLPALDHASAGPAGLAGAAELLDDVRLTTDLVYFCPPSAVGRAGEAAMTRFVQALADQGGTSRMHAIAHGIATFERDRHRGTPDAAAVARTLQQIEVLARLQPALADRLGVLAGRMRDAQPRGKKKPPGPVGAGASK